MAITLNGIAQGFATDRVTEVLASHGFTQTVVNIGEYRVGERLAAIGICGAADKILSIENLKQAAIATSVPGAIRFSDRTFHILDPQNPDTSPNWASASVVATTAAMADALSTALVLANGTALAQILAKRTAQTIILEDAKGKIVRI
jgi:thiamine biosynthesis lipoprotein